MNIWAWFFILVILLPAAGLVLAEFATERPMAEPRDPEAPDICGATDGELVCTVPPHAGDLHLDGTRGTQYHSATFRVGRAA